jgi:hypothetical protein
LLVNVILTGLVARIAYLANEIAKQGNETSLRSSLSARLSSIHGTISMAPDQLQFRVRNIGGPAAIAETYLIQHESACQPSVRNKVGHDHVADILIARGLLRKMKIGKDYVDIESRGCLCKLPENGMKCWNLPPEEAETFTKPVQKSR